MQSKLIGIPAAIALCAAMAAADVSAQIYKTVDKDGNVVFTDVPPSDNTGAVKLDDYNTYEPVTPAPAPVTPRRSTADAEDAQAQPDIVYESVSIIAPLHDESIRENAGMVSVSVNISPSLDTSAGHKLQVLLDGTVMAEGEMSTIVLENVDRGTHQITAQITASNGEVLAQSAPSTFHLQRFSVLLAPKNKAP